MGRYSVHCKHSLCLVAFMECAVARTSEVWLRIAILLQSCRALHCAQYKGRVLSECIVTENYQRLSSISL